MKKRVFIAINLPSSIKEKIFLFIQSLKEKNSHLRIKWVEKENLHLTLHFLGYLEDKELSQVEKIVESSLSQTKPTRLRLEEIGGFPRLSSPRVIFLKTKEIGEDSIHFLQKEIGQKLKKMGFFVDSRLWKAHITLGRNKTGRGQLSLIKNSLVGEEFEVQSIEIMESKLSPLGPKYKIIKSFKFPS